jgi:hypothetical protein
MVMSGDVGLSGEWKFGIPFHRTPDEVLMLHAAMGQNAV